MLPTMIIFFRESLEASLIVGILLAYVHRVGRGDAARPVWAGVAAALAVDAALAVATYHIIHVYDGSRVQSILEGFTYVAAAGLLAAMSLWMKEQSRGLRRDLEARVRAALSRGSLAALVLLSAVTVGREGLETMFFTLAIAFTSSAWALWTGAACGLAAGLLVSFVIHRLGRRVPLGLFFNVLGVLLLLFAAGLVADAVQDFQVLGWLPFLTAVLWHSQGLLNENSLAGDLLHSFFGYADQPTRLQVAAYAGFLAATVGAYARAGRRSAAGPRAAGI